MAMAISAILIAATTAKDKEKEMRLWTVQPRELYEEIMRTGKYMFDSTKHPFREDFEEAYAWMEHVMESAGQGSAYAGAPLVWAWHTYDNAHQCPPLDGEALWSDGKDEVLLEIEVPDEDVLLSDFDAWHYVLNKWYLGNAAYFGLNDDAAMKEMEWFDTLPTEPVNTKKFVMQESWGKIFNVSDIEYIQATFWGLCKEQIMAVYERPKPATEAEKDAFEHKCYEAYKINWMISHGITMGEMQERLIAISAENVQDGLSVSSKNDVRQLYGRAMTTLENDEGFGGSIWACFNEFMDTEFRDTEYMEMLLSLMENKSEMATFYRVNY